MSAAQFYLACYEGRMSEVRGMVEHINTEYRGDTGLVAAIVRKHWDIVTFLTTQPSIDIQWKDSDQYTYLHWASMRNAPVSVVTTLVERMGPELCNAGDSGGMTAIEYAVMNNYSPTVSCLGGRGEVAWDMGRLESTARYTLSGQDLEDMLALLQRIGERKKEDEKAWPATSSLYSHSAQTEQRTGISHTGKNYLGIAICFDAYEGSLKLETAAITEEMRDIVETLKNKFRYKFPYENSMGLDTFVNPEDLMRSLDIFLTKKYMKVHAQSTDVCLLYFHGHGKFVNGQPCIRTLSGKDNIIPVFEIMNKVHAKTHAGRFYIIFDCCSDFPEDEVDKDTRERVEKVQKTQKDVTFSDRVVVITAAPAGHTAPATAGETLSSVMSRVLQSNNGKGFSLDDLQQQLSEEYHRRNLEPIFTINRQNNPVFPY